jgi:hypothetical protein
MREVEKIGKYSALLSIIEIGLGSFLHSLKIPFSGHTLSLNQGFILTKASLEVENKNTPALISTTSALLKSLSPAGKKLTPMLAISMQGQLFNLGTRLLGRNILGHILGMTLLCMWSFIQPLCIYLILFGKDLIYMTQYFIKKISKVIPVTEEGLLVTLLVILTIKITLGVIAVALAYKFKGKELTVYQEWAKKQKPRQKKASEKSPYLLALKDLLNPLFIVSIALTVIFYIYSRSTHATVIWGLLRPIAGGYLIFLAIRIFPIENLSNKMKDGKYKALFNETLKRIKEI